MVQAILLEVLNQNAIRHFKIKEKGTNKIGVYSEHDIYNALINNKIQIEYLSTSKKFNTVIVDSHFLAMQIHKNYISSKPENDTIPKVKKKPKAKKATKKKGNNPRLSVYDNKIKKIELLINNKKYSRDKMHKALNKTADPDEQFELQEKINSLEADIYELCDRKLEIKQDRQKEQDLIDQEKMDIRNAKYRRTHAIARYRKIIDEHGCKLDYYIETENSLESEIKLLEEKIPEAQFQYEKEKIHKEIRRINKQLKGIRGCRKTIEDAMEKLKEHEAELKDGS